MSVAYIYIVHVFVYVYLYVFMLSQKLMSGCLHVCQHTYGAYVLVCVHIHKLMSGILPNHRTFYLLRQGLSPNLELTGSASLSSQLAR